MKDWANSDLDEAIERLAVIFPRELDDLIFLDWDALARIVLKLDNDRFAFFPDKTSDSSFSFGYANGDSITIFIGCIEA